MNIQKLAAVELALLGPAFVLTEYTLAVAALTAFGVWTVLMARHSGPIALTAFGAYLISLGLNYVPLLAHAVRIARGRTANAIIGDELVDRQRAARKYRRQSLVLLVPFAVLIAAVTSS